jgi:hypothetical protein
MFCPKCRVEYRAGYSRCADCDVDLVERLEKVDRESDKVPPDENLMEVWAGEDQVEAIINCKQLKEAGIPYKVIQNNRQFLKGVDRNFKIGVPQSYIVQADEVIKEAQMGFSDSPEDQHVLELPDQAGLTPSEEGNHEQFPREWRKEDATIEVSVENIQHYIGMIELALRENHIRVRAETSDDGSRKIFVLPEDESRAREIAHEVEDGIPPA